MSYKAQMIADSVGPNGVRLSSIYLRYPMKVHWDLMTHRAFSRNASSGRSISVTRMVKWLENGPVKPLAWIKDNRGMKSGGLLGIEASAQADEIWQQAFNAACHAAKQLELIGVHRQDANSLLMPFGWINVLVTATSWDNFLSLRVSKAARPEMQKVAVMLGRALQSSTPKQLKAGEWHLPFVTDTERSEYPTDMLLQLSVARSGHLTDEADEDKSFSIARELSRFDRFLEECAWSTFEHQGLAQEAWERSRSGNFLGWHQYRQSLETSVHESFDYNSLDDFGPQEFLA